MTDSSASLPPDAGRLGPLFVAPLQLVLDGRTYLDGVDMTPAEFYRRQSAFGGTTTTSAPTPNSFQQAFTRALEVADSVLCLTVSPNFSATHAAAIAGLQAAADGMEHPLPISIVDTESAAGGEGLVVTAALRAAAAGAGLEEVTFVARNVTGRVHLVAYLDTLYYVWKSGRVPVVAHWGTSVLQIKPIFEMRRGAVKSLARVRSARGAAEKLLDLVRKRIEGPLHATVMHANAPEMALSVTEVLRSSFEVRELYVSEFSPVMGSHTGPGLVGIAYWCEERQ